MGVFTEKKKSYIYQDGIQNQVLTYNKKEWKKKQ